MVNDGGHAVVGTDGQELGPKLLAASDVDGHEFVGDVGLLEKDRDLPTVGRRPKVQIDHGCAVKLGKAVQKGKPLVVAGAGSASLLKKG